MHAGNASVRAFEQAGPLSHVTFHNRRPVRRSPLDSMPRPRFEVLTAPQRSASMPLSQVCEAAGRAVDVVLAPRGLDVPLRRVCIHDPQREVHRDDLVLVPGGPEALLGTPTAAVAAKLRSLPPGWMLAAFEAAGVALLSVEPELEWGELYGMLAPLLSAGGAFRSLDELADETAQRAGGPVTIEDHRSRLLAYSRGGQDIDAARAATVLERHVPERWMRELRPTGAIDRLMRCGEIVGVQVPGLAPRRVAPVRAGGRTVGGIWLAGEDVARSADAALRDAALLVTARLARDEAEEHV